MSEQQKNELIEQFRHYLASPTASGELDDITNTPGTFSIVAELAAVKTAVRWESRQFKQALVEFNDTCKLLVEDQAIIENGFIADEQALLQELTALKTQIKQESQQHKKILDQVRTLYTELLQRQQTFKQQLQRQREQSVQQARDNLRPLLLQLLALGDALQAGVEMHPPQSNWWGRLFCRTQLAWMPKSHAGLQLNWQQLQDILTQQSITPIEALGQPFNPHTMKAIEVDHLPDMADGVVTLEIRQGYEWEGALLRYAEVKVNRVATESSETN